MDTGSVGNTVRSVMDQALAGAGTWGGLGARDKLRLWLDWLQTPPDQRLSNPLHVVLSVIEEVS